MEEFIGSTTPKTSDESKLEIQPNLGFQRVIQRAVFHVQSSGKEEVNGSNILVAIFSEKNHMFFFWNSMVLQDLMLCPISVMVKAINKIMQKPK